MGDILTYCTKIHFFPSNPLLFLSPKGSVKYVTMRFKRELYMKREPL